MMASRRTVLQANNAKLVFRNTTTKVTQRRVYLTQSKPPPTAPQHVRGYRSSLQNPYFVPNPVILEAPPPPAFSLWQQAFRWYSDKLSSHPLITKSLTGAVIAAAGDVLCQAGTFQPKDDSEERFWSKWDIRRSFHFFVLGLTFVAPTSHYWYGNLAKHTWTKGQSFGQITKRVVLDQFVWTPVFFVIWLSGFWTMERNGQITGKEVKTDLAAHLPDVMVANWLLWIPAQYLNFYACPVKFQVLFTNVVELVWNAYLSFATSGEGGHGGGGQKKQIEQEEPPVLPQERIV